MTTVVHKFAALILAGLLLGGCAGTAARIATDAAYLHETAGAYVREIHAFRQFIRAECKASLVREIDTLRQDGDEAKLRATLAGNYPGLVSVDGIMQAQEDPAGILATAPGCNGGKLPE
jgi:hypothetical protein